MGRSEASTEKIPASESALVGERKVVTVLFCGLGGSTVPAECPGPEVGVSDEHDCPLELPG